MRRLITALILIALLITVAAVNIAAAPAPTPTSPLYIRWDRGNNVLCYSPNAQFDVALSCVYIPPDGVQVNLPKPGPGTT